MKKIRETKIIVHNIQESEKVQKKLFELGCKWIGRGKEYTNLEDRYLYIDKDLRILSSEDNKKYFDESKYTELYSEDLLNLKKPKFSGFELKCTAEMRKDMFGEEEDFVVKFIKSLAEQELHDRGVDDE